MPFEVSEDRSNMATYDDPRLCAEVVKVVARSELPVSIDYVRHHLAIGWQTARAALFNLVVEGRLIGRKTTAGWTFSVNEEERGQQGGRARAQLSSRSRRSRA